MSDTESLARAYAACEAMARSHYENFPVASWLLPVAMRPHVAAVYAFARDADDIADEGTAAPAERQAGLDAWRERVHAAAEGKAGRDDLIALALGHSIRTLDLPVSLFDDLLSAFGQDTMTSRYASWADVFDYCRRSANPVGRLVLRIGGYRDDGLDRSSDALCTALQLTNFWQDFGRDWRAGRLYVPRDVIDACGAREADLQNPELTEAWVRAVAACVDVTAARFDEGRAVCDGVRGRLKFELRFTWLGARRILTRVQRSGASLMRQRPALGAADAVPILGAAALWKAGP